MVWTTIIIEGYCMYDVLGKRRWIGYEWKNGKIGKKKHITENKDYIPKTSRPSWCRNKNKTRIPQFKCMTYGKECKRCPFFSMVNATRKEYNLFWKEWAKYEKEKGDNNG